MFASKSLIHQAKPKWRNLIMLFLTIVLGLGSVMVFAQLSIDTSILNARQTIMRVTITDDGTDAGNVLVDFNSGNRIFINTSILDPQISFTGNVLGLDTNGNMIYVPVAGLSLSGGIGGGGTGDWTTAGSDIYRPTGNVGIGSAPTTGKLYVTSVGEAELAVEETNAGNAANIHFINPTRTWTIGGDSSPDLFYIGTLGNAFFNILSTGNVGIGTTGPKAPLQVVGNFIAGSYNNSAIGTNNFIGGGDSNVINGRLFNYIGGGDYNSILGTSQSSSIIGGESNKIENSNFSVAGGYMAYASHNNSFVRNSDPTSTGFESTTVQQFLINAPYDDSKKGGVGINVNDPTTDLDVKGLIRTRLQSALPDCGGPNDRQGAIGFSGTHFYGCDGTGRIQLDN